MIDIKFVKILRFIKNEISLLLGKNGYLYYWPRTDISSTELGRIPLLMSKDGYISTTEKGRISLPLSKDGYSTTE